MPGMRRVQHWGLDHCSQEVKMTFSSLYNGEGRVEKANLLPVALVVLQEAQIKGKEKQ